jgi:type II secretory pathway component PulF
VRGRASKGWKASLANLLESGLTLVEALSVMESLGELPKRSLDGLKQGRALSELPQLNRLGEGWTILAGLSQLRVFQSVLKALVAQEMWQQAWQKKATRLLMMPLVGLGLISVIGVLMLVLLVPGVMALGKTDALPWLSQWAISVYQAPWMGVMALVVFIGFALGLWWVGLARPVMVQLSQIRFFQMQAIYLTAGWVQSQALVQAHSGYWPGLNRRIAMTCQGLEAGLSWRESLGVAGWPSFVLERVRRAESGVPMHEIWQGLAVYFQGVLEKRLSVWMVVIPQGVMLLSAGLLTGLAAALLWPFYSLLMGEVGR